MDIVTKYIKYKSIYELWLAKMSFNFLILTIVFDNIIPIDIIRYILLIFLKIEQNQLSAFFKWKSSCNNKECILKWWKNNYNTDSILTQASYIHCCNESCHNIYLGIFGKCQRCYKCFCEKCTDSNIDFTYTYRYRSICKECHTIIFKYPEQLITCSDCFIKIPLYSNEQLFIYYSSYVYIYSDECDICYNTTCGLCSYRCTTGCYSHFCKKCTPYFTRGDNCLLCENPTNKLLGYDYSVIK